MQQTNNFGIEFLKFLILETQNNVYEYDRFPFRTKNSFKNKLVFGVVYFLERVYKKIKIILLSSNGKLIATLKSGDFNKFEFLYNHLNDTDSKKKYIKCLAFQLLGKNIVNLEMDNEYYVEADKLRKLSVKHDENKENFINDFFELSALGYQDIKLWNNPYGIYITFVKEQYAYKNLCIVKDGDIVIDAGGCYGDTALYFASKVGVNGKVYVYEFIPNNIKIMQEHFKLNLHVSSRIEIVPHPVDNISNKVMYFTDLGPSSKIESVKKEDSLSITTLSIDDTIKKYNIDKIDYIKMDIEGSELSALEGAKKTIEKFSPRLAICVYHKLEDFYEIPMFIDSLGGQYTYYFDYYTPVGWEMVLYCIPKSL